MTVKYDIDEKWILCDVENPKRYIRFEEESVLVIDVSVSISLIIDDGIGLGDFRRSSKHCVILHSYWFSKRWISFLQKEPSKRKHFTYQTAILKECRKPSIFRFSFGLLPIWFSLKYCHQNIFDGIQF